MAKEYTLIGGNGTVVSPLEVTEDGDYVAGDSRAFNPVKVRTGGSSTLAGLTDVDLTNPTDGQTLVYDAASSKWVNGSGGGGLPTPTAADVGAGLTVQAVHTPGAVVVPEQTAAWSDDADGFLLTNVNASLFTAGATVLVTVNGEGGVATVVDEGRFLKAEPDEAVGEVGWGIYYDSDLDVFTAWPVDLDPFPETVTASCNLAVDAYTWAVDPYAGYDVVIKLDVGDNASSLDDSKLHLVKGSYADAIAKAGRGQPISAFVYSIINYEGETYYRQFHVLEMYADIGYHDAVEISIGTSPLLGSLVRNADNSGSVQLYNATTIVPIKLYLTESGLSVLPPWS